MFSNPYNWISIARSLFVIVNPFSFFWAIFRKTKIESVKLRTPIGIVDVQMRNFESMRTLYTMFCRLDYFIDRSKTYVVMDCGSNIGLASVYFLSRNKLNIVVCFEPDRANITYLKDNLSQFSGRYFIHEAALSTESGAATLYRAEDGKYSSLLPSDRTGSTDLIECMRFEDALASVTNNNTDTVVKMDVEGLEIELIGSVEWSKFPNVRYIFSESAGCSDVISRPHRLQLRNGMLEVITFE